MSLKAKSKAATKPGKHDATASVKCTHIVLVLGRLASLTFSIREVIKKNLNNKKISVLSRIFSRIFK